MNEIDRRRALVRRILPRAGRLALGHFRAPGLKIDLKSAQDPVTEADLAVEEYLYSAIAAAFPGDGFLCEERGAVGELGNDNYVWVIDPIDGTANYARGIPHWCISVALVRGDRVELGFIEDPVDRERFEAARDAGATLNGRPLLGQWAATLGEARVNVGFSYRRPPELHLRGISLLLDAGCEYSRLASGALGLAWLACGRFDGYWEPHINAWDAAAGIAIAREAGAWINGFFDGDGLLGGNPLLACGPRIARDLLALLEPINEESRRLANRGGGKK